LEELAADVQGDDGGGGGHGWGVIHGGCAWLG
jgi:hypothetical protein